MVFTGPILPFFLGRTGDALSASLAKFHDDNFLLTQSPAKVFHPLPENLVSRGAYPKLTRLLSDEAVRHRIEPATFHVQNGKPLWKIPRRNSLNPNFVRP